MANDRKDKRLLNPVPAGLPPALAPEFAEAEGGTIRVSDAVIGAIVRKYTLEVPGVVRFASVSLVGGLAEMIGRKTADSNIVIDMENGSVAISVNLVLAFGCRVPEVAAAVQEVIRGKVEEFTDKKVSRVNVTIQDLDDGPRKAAPAAAPAVSGEAAGGNGTPPAA